ncbi:DUF1631 family protein [Pseudohalioglobus lutimaris]|nr:DUF1631 family protein [Pseudohalioglobus lutimaris]
MPREDLFNYLNTIDNFDIGPLQAVLAQTEVIGEPALPASEDIAALAWVGAAFDHWERHFTLDQPLAARVRRLKPVLGLMALADSQFYIPGIHPLHQVLDGIYDASVGWQESLGRAGEPVEKLIDQTVEGAMACLEENGSGLMALLRESIKSAQRLEKRTRRMVQRTADGERGQLRAARAKEVAATMINKEITRHPIPADIGYFLTRPWFESAQLVLLKYGENSSQWQEISAATSNLMATLAPQEEGGPAAEAGAEAIQQIRRWLLSLQHDQQQTEEAISTIEFTQLRVAKGMDIERSATSLIPIAKSSPQTEENSSLNGVETGQWYQVEARKGGILRIQLAMMQPREQRLMFCNHAGARVQSMDYRAFAELLERGKAKHLDTGVSFSRSLAAVIGVDTPEALSRLTGEPAAAMANADPVPAPAPAPATAAAPKRQPKSPPADTEKGALTEEPTITPAAVVTEPPPATQPPSPAPKPEVSELPPVQVESEPNPEPDLPESGIPELPMGTWLGFHDLDPPLLAKLAMHDKVRRLLIFVNRKGIELRRLPEEEYLALLQEGQVDILEAKTNFREQVEMARKRMARHQT